MITKLRTQPPSDTIAAPVESSQQVKPKKQPKQPKKDGLWLVSGLALVVAVATPT